jgi:hypothetical protein
MEAINWNLAKTKKHDASGIDNPCNYNWIERNGIFYPYQKINSEPKKTFYLFGSDACIEYRENGVDGLIKAWENNEVTVGTFLFTHGETHPNELLSNFEGWADFQEITEEEFNLL